MDLWMGRVNSPLDDTTDKNTFQSFPLKLAADADIQPHVALLEDTGRAAQQWVVWGVLSADVPANSYARVSLEFLKSGRF